MDELHEAMEQLHCEKATTSAKKRSQARDRQAKSKPVQLLKLTIRDFVLVGQVPRQGNKLSLHWRSPSKIFQFMLDMETQQLLQPYDLSLYHACRLKMYCEGGRDVTEHLADHIAFGNKGFHVAKLGDVREEKGEY
ncbi:hypothetical protein DYB37_013275 [Aphanomyces astaci]|uniref:Uncharacterized protein n=1 Tax=Aphanomyces astaci TaxID=112090 RepID=A0A3R7BYJ7_APHAT|nr:hypothetical protein DYB37_013275 [Aphanomyces astaci]